MFNCKGDLVRASVCTSFVSQTSNPSAIVEVRLNSIRIADVLVNGDMIDFHESNAYQFQGKFNKYTDEKSIPTLKLLFYVLKIVLIFNSVCNFVYFLPVFNCLLCWPRIACATTHFQHNFLHSALALYVTFTVSQIRFAFLAHQNC